MADDRGPKRRIAGDTERANAGKRSRTPPRGLRVPRGEFDDEEPTPLPVMVTEPDEGWDLSDQVSALRVDVRNQAAVSERLWNERNNSEHIKRLDNRTETMVGDLAKLIATVNEFLVPGLKSVMGRLESAELHRTKLQPRLDTFYAHEWPELVKTVTGLDDRLRRLENGQERQERALLAQDDRLLQTAGGLSKRIDILNSESTVRDVKIRALEDWRLATTAKVVAIASAVSAAVAGIGLALSYFT